MKIHLETISYENFKCDLKSKDGFTDKIKYVNCIKCLQIAIEKHNIHVLYTKNEIEKELNQFLKIKTFNKNMKELLK